MDPRSPYIKLLKAAIHAAGSELFADDHPEDGTADWSCESNEDQIYELARKFVLDYEQRERPPDKAIWTCKIGRATRATLPEGADGPMREAVGLAYLKLTHKEPDFIFSGWAGRLTPEEQESLV